MHILFGPIHNNPLVVPPFHALDRYSVLVDSRKHAVEPLHPLKKAMGLLVFVASGTYVPLPAESGWYPVILYVLFGVLESIPRLLSGLISTGEPQKPRSGRH